MIPLQTFRGQTVAVFGLGGSGTLAAQALMAGGAHVLAWDDSYERCQDVERLGVPVANLREIDWSGVSALVLAPGVPLTHPVPHWVVGLAHAHGVPVIGDIELFVRERRAVAPLSPFIAITGTNGKSTTTALISHLLRHAGHQVETGGNIGTAILSLAPPAMGRTHVIEVSSYQIDLAPSLDPLVGILLNLSEDHLDRHGSMAGYAAVKERLVAGVPPHGTAVIGVDDVPSQAIADRLEQHGTRVVRISVTRPLADGVYAAGEDILLAEGGASRVVARLGGVGALRGVHNAQNACAAFAAVSALGLNEAQIQAGLASFPGLVHRMQTVGRLGKVLFINDSKATNADAAARALACFEDIYWILGGRAKTGGIESLSPFFSRVRRAYLIGEASDAFARTLADTPHLQCGTLDVAVREATRDARLSDSPHPVVLFSPACASFDQYRNFELRGEHFRECVVKSLDSHSGL